MNVTTKRLKSNLHPLHFTESFPSQKKLLLDDDQFKECAQGWPLYIDRVDCTQFISVKNMKYIFTWSVEVTGYKDQFNDLWA